jgi:hypothetical protein
MIWGTQIEKGYQSFGSLLDPSFSCNEETRVFPHFPAQKESYIVYTKPIPPWNAPPNPGGGEEAEWNNKRVY